MSGAWRASINPHDLHAGEAYVGDWSGGFPESLRIVILGVARLGSGFFGRSATRTSFSAHEGEPDELLSLSSLSTSSVDEDEDEEADDSSSEWVSRLLYSKTPSPRFYER